MIVLVEPVRPTGFTSGGYRYQECVFDRIAPSFGKRVSTQASALDQTIENVRRDIPGAIIVVDGLFAEQCEGPLPNNTIALLHMVPSRSDWCSSPMHVIATSAITAHRVASQSLSVSIVRPGIDKCFDQDRQQRTAKEPVDIICVGTICEQKGQARLVSLLKPIANPWRLTLIGSHEVGSPELLRIRKHADGLRITVRRPVSIHQLADSFAKHDLLVSMSLNESFGMAVAEAAAAGLPVLALDTGEISNFVTTGRNGWLLPTNATDKEIHAQLDRLIADPSELERAEGGRTRPDLDDWDTVADHFASTCQQIASGE